MVPHLMTKIAAVAILGCLLSLSLFAQSGVKASPTPTPPADETSKGKPVILPAPDIKYEVIGPKTVVDFMYALKEAGKRGFRLDKITALPTGMGQTAREQVGMTVLAGIVRFDGTATYDYNFFSAESDPEPDKKLNSMAQIGWYLKDVISIYGGSLASDEIFANSVYSFPTDGNLYIVERVGSQPSHSSYLLLKAGATLGRNPEAKLQALMDQARNDGYKIRANYYTFIAKSLFSIDSAYCLLMEKVPGADTLERKVLTSARSGGLRKEILKYAQEGYRIDSINFNSAILSRKKDSDYPVSYALVDAQDKAYKTSLGSVTAKNPVYRIGGIGQVGSGAYLKDTLIFEDNSTAEGDLFDFETIKWFPIVPKEFKNNPQEYLDKLEKPEIAFKRLLSDGYAPADIFYSGAEGMTVLLERKKPGGKK